MGGWIHECGVREEVRAYRLGIFGRQTIFKTQGEGFNREEKGSELEEIPAKGLRKTGQWGVRKIRTQWSRSYKKQVLQEGRGGICAGAECDSWKRSYFVMTSGQKQHSSQMTYILSFFKSYEVKLKKRTKNNAF